MNWLLPERCRCGRVATLRLVMVQWRDDLRLWLLCYQCQCGRKGGMSVTEAEAAEVFRDETFQSTNNPKQKETTEP